jgi:c(7)-type cytochrome triheme protein
MSRCRAIIVVALAAAVGGGFAGAQSLPKLPDGLPMTKAAESPGQVTFNHITHVDPAKPDCTACHPKDFGILGSKGGTKTPVLHEKFQQGRQCGRCHDGKQAFAVDDDCTSCHVP